jgi:hypothetical protein
MVSQPPSLQQPQNHQYTSWSSPTHFTWPWASKSRLGRTPNFPKARATLVWADIFRPGHCGFVEGGRGTEVHQEIAEGVWSQNTGR